MIDRKATSGIWCLVLMLLAAPALAAAQEHEAEHPGDGGVENHGHEYHPNEIAVFVLRLGVVYGIPLGGSWELAPAINLDLVESEKVWVYGANVAFGW